MAQQETAAKTAENPVNTTAEIQREFFGTLAKMNQRWLDRAAAEAKLASELGSKLSAARSVPDAIEAYQQWMAQRTHNLAENSQQFVTDCQTLMHDAARRLPKSWPVASS